MRADVLHHRHQVVHNLYRTRPLTGELVRRSIIACGGSIRMRSTPRPLTGRRPAWVRIWRGGR
jgi:hypothetical protein